MPRTILAHLNIEVPDDSTATADDIAAEVAGALDVGTDPDHTPTLATAEVVITLVEEI